MEIMNLFLSRLTELMKEKEINAKQLATQINISAASISQWHSSTVIVSVKHLLLLADYFNCSIEYLIGRSDIYLNYEPAPIIPFYTRIKDLIRENGYTRYRFVKETRFTEGHLSQWKKGSIPKLPTLLDLSALFNCTIDYLVGRER